MHEKQTSLAEYRRRYARPGSPALRTVQLYAHKGASGLMPENTLPAYETALVLGVDVVDADLALTREREIVISHDQALNPDITRARGKDGSWAFLPATPAVPIRTLSYAELAAYDVGSIDPSSAMARSFPAQRQMDGVSIPRLASLLALLRAPGNERVRLNVEIKVDPSHPGFVYPTTVIVPLLILELEAHGMLERTEIQSFDWKALEEVGALRPAATRAFLSDPGNPQWLAAFQAACPGAPPVTMANYAQVMVETIGRLEGPGISIWEPYGLQFEDARKNLVDALTGEMVALAHARGIPVVPWTLYDSVSDPPAYAPYSPALSRSTATWLAMGVDGMLTNRVDIARGIMAAHGYSLPG